MYLCYRGESVREIVHTQNEVPFGLRGSSKSMVVEITTPFHANQEVLLTKVQSVYTPNAGEGGIVGSIVGFLTGSRSTGVETTEELLPIETSITAVGQLVMAAKDKYILMPTGDDTSHPYVLTTSMRGTS